MDWDVGIIASGTANLQASQNGMRLTKHQHICIDAKISTKYDNLAQSWADILESSNYVLAPIKSVIFWQGELYT